jgi:putative N6-adenine-specific DNA methylase
MVQTREYTLGMDFTVKTFAGLEDVLARELKEIGARDIEIINRGVTFRGGAEDLYKSNYMLRTALRVLKPVGVFKVKDDDELYQKVMKIDWTEVFRIDQTFSVNANLFHSALTHSHYVALRTKDAIVDQFREKTGKRPWVGKEDADIYIDVHISQDVCTVSLDSSGASLHRRGYRISADKAPINEVLAAGMVQLTGWKGDKDFYDPMCGSGTIPIEAAMLAMKIPSGYYRDKYAFMNWADYDETLWSKVKEEADLEMGELNCSIFASDRSDKAIGIARRNLRNAGLHKDVEIRKQFFDAIKPQEKKGILVFNPPYGKRLEEKGEIIDLYKKIGDTLKNDFTGFEAWIITGDFDVAKFIGLKPSKKLTLFNGPIETKFIKYEMYEGSKRGGQGKDFKKKFGPGKRPFQSGRYEKRKPRRQ